MKIKLFLASLLMVTGLAHNASAQVLTEESFCGDTVEVELSCKTITVCADSADAQAKEDLEEIYCNRGWGPC